MTTGILYFVVIGLMIAVVIVLMVGLGAFTSGGEFNKKYANLLMRWRIILQAIAIAGILIYVGVSAATGGG